MMKVTFTTLTEQPPGVLAGLLRASYAALLETDPFWQREALKWDEYDRQAFAHPASVGACLFLTRWGERIAGFASWDPRPRPVCAWIGHNCILPEFRSRGLGRQQIAEILRRLQVLGVKTAKVSTLDHPFFLPARRMYLACGFRAVWQMPWEQDPDLHWIEYEKDLDASAP